MLISMIHTQDNFLGARNGPLIEKISSEGLGKAQTSGKMSSLQYFVLWRNRYIFHDISIPSMKPKHIGENQNEGCT